MDAHDRLLSLIETLYSAPGSIDGWRRFLSALCGALDGTAASFISHDLKTRQGTVEVVARADPDALREYVGHWIHEDPWAHGARARRLLGGTVMFGEQVISRAALGRTAFYNDFSRRYDIAQSLVAVIESDADALSGFSINASDTHRGFGASDVALLEALMPHLQRALQMHRQIALADASLAASGGALDAIPMAVALLNAAQEIVFLNRTARELVASRDGLEVEGRQLRGASAADTERLRGAVRAAGVTSRITAGHPLSFTLRRQSAAAPLQVVVVPAASQSSGVLGLALGDGPRASVAVFVSDPDRDAIEAPERLARLFGFTPAESRVACLLADGVAVGDIAAMLAVSESTVRWHVKQVLHKAGVRSQTQLVSLILRGPAALRGGR